MVSKASLTAAQLTSMRGTMSSTMADLCNVIRNVEVLNGAGGNVKTATTVYSNVPIIYGPFRVPFLKQLEALETRVDSKTRWEAEFPFGTDIQIKDRLFIHGTGHTYEVASHRSPQTFGLDVGYLLELVD